MAGLDTPRGDLVEHREEQVIVLLVEEHDPGRSLSTQRPFEMECRVEPAEAGPEDDDLPIGHR